MVLFLPCLLIDVSHLTSRYGSVARQHIYQHCNFNLQVYLIYDYVCTWSLVNDFILKQHRTNLTASDLKNTPFQFFLMHVAPSLTQLLACFVLWSFSCSLVFIKYKWRWYFHLASVSYKSENCKGACGMLLMSR